MRQDDSLLLLMISQSRNETEVLTNHLRNAGYMVHPLRVDDEKRLTAALQGQDWDLLIHLPDALDLQITTVLALLAKSQKDIPVIMVADDAAPTQKLQLLNAGVHDIVPLDPPGLLQKAVRRELEGLRLRRRLRACQDDREAIEQRSRLLLDSTKDAVAYVQEGMHVLANPVYLQTFLFSDANEVIGVPLLDVVPIATHHHLKGLLRTTERTDSAAQCLEVTALRANGEQFPARFHFTPTVFDGEACIQVVVHDLSLTGEFQKQLDKLKERDPFTGLYHRQYFLQELERMLPARPGLIYLTLDNLATLRSKIGIVGTDTLLKAMATLIGQHAEPDDLVAVFGDGIFILLAARGEEARLHPLAERMLKALGNCLIEVGGVTVSPTSSLCIHPAHLRVKDSQTLLARLAETVTTAARQPGGNGIVVCQPEVSVAPPAVGNILSAALDKRKLFLVYQPIVYLRGDGREFYEVFPRIIGSGGGHPIPEQAMRALDDAHLPAATDRWTISQALEVLVLRRTQGSKPVHLWIEISHDTLMDETFPSWLTGKLHASGIPATNLIFQIHDSLAVDYYLRVRDFVPSLHGLGCGFALARCRGDASVYSQLRQLDIDFFRIDGTLIHDLATNREHQALVRTINERVHALGKHTLAESVRDANTLSVLWQYGTDYIQGEYLQKPSEAMDYDFSSMFIE